MSVFETVGPMPTPFPPSHPDIKIPGWLRLATCIMSCTPCVLLILYWFKRVKCEQLVNWYLILSVGSIALILFWYFSSGTYNRMKTYDEMTQGHMV